MKQKYLNLEARGSDSCVCRISGRAVKWLINLSGTQPCAQQEWRSQKPPFFDGGRKIVKNTGSSKMVESRIFSA